MDRHDGLSRKWTSWRLKKEVLILENEEERYEISLQHQAGTDARRFDQYRFAVISPRTSLSGWSKAGYPLDSADLTEVLYEDLDWQDFEWVERGVVIQPSPREKHGTTTSNGGGSLMEGVEATSKDGDVDMEDGEIHDGGKGSAHQAATSNKSDYNAQDGDDAHQEGVFCVVSRLYWRPMSESGPTKRTVTPAAVKPAEVTGSAYVKSVPVAAIQNGPTKDVPDYHSTNVVVAAGQGKTLATSTGSGIQTANSIHNTTVPAKLNHEYSVGAPVASPVAPEEHYKEDKKELERTMPAVVEPVPVPVPQQQQQHPSQQPTPTAAASSTLEQQHLAQPAAAEEPSTTKAPKVPTPVVHKDVEAMDVDSSIQPTSRAAAPTPAEPKVVPAPVVVAPTPTPTPVAVQQKPAEVVKPAPAAVAQEPLKAAAPVVAPAVALPEEDEREEGELEEGEITSD
jgi:hypothetical protein